MSLYTKAIKSEKNDNKDAKWIADFFKLGIVRSSYILAKDICILRKLTRVKIFFQKFIENIQKHPKCSEGIFLDAHRDMADKETHRIYKKQFPECLQSISTY